MSNKSGRVLFRYRTGVPKHRKRRRKLEYKRMEKMDKLTQKKKKGLHIAITNTTGQRNVPVSREKLAGETKVRMAKMVKNKKRNKTKQNEAKKMKEFERHKTAHKKKDKIQPNVGEKSPSPNKCTTAAVSYHQHHQLYKKQR